MQKTAKKVSLSTKNTILSQLLAIAKTSKLYLEDKFALDKLLCVIKRQRKKLKKARVLLDVDDKEELLVKFSTVIRIVEHLIKDDTSMFVQNINALDRWVSDTEKQLGTIQAELSDNTTATDSVRSENKQEEKDTTIKDSKCEENNMQSKKIKQEVSK